jgi:hypothetical protein
MTAAADVLMQSMRARAAGTALAAAKVSTLRECLLKVAIWVKKSVRRIVIHFPVLPLARLLETNRKNRCSYNLSRLNIASINAIDVSLRKARVYFCPARHVILRMYHSHFLFFHLGCACAQFPRSGKSFPGEATQFLNFRE